MIVILMTGGLGNQMFHYALYKKLLYFNKNVKIDDLYSYKYGLSKNRNPELNRYFGIDYKKVGKLQSWFLNYSDRYPESELGKHFDILSNKAYDNDYYNEKLLYLNHAYLDGYFQSEQYFIEPEVQKQLREDFKMPKNFVKSEQFHLLEEKIKATNSVSIHIRRTDYLKVKYMYQNDFILKYGGICTEKYYKDAIEYIQRNVNNPCFFVFSDDKDYIIEKYKNKENFIIVNEDNTLRDDEEFFLMSMCKHHIIANSSFSWWASWINDGDQSVIVAPDKWISNKDYEQIYRPKMIRIKGQ